MATDSTCISSKYADDFVYRTTPRNDPAESLEYKTRMLVTSSAAGVSTRDRSPDMQDLRSKFNDRTSRPTMVRFDPDFLRKPAALIPESQGIAFADEQGSGLSSVFDAIVNRDTDAFMTIQAEARSLFPSLAKRGLINVSDSMKEIAATLVDGTRVGASELSEGLLYVEGSKTPVFSDFEYP